MSWFPCIDVRWRWISLKSQFGVRRCATAYSMFYACKCSLDLLYLTVKMLSHRKSSGVVYRNSFVTRFKIEETDDIPGDYLVTLFSFGRFIRQKNQSYWILENWKQHYCDFYEIFSVLPLHQPFYLWLKWYRNFLRESQKVKGGAGNVRQVRQSYSCLLY